LLSVPTALHDLLGSPEGEAEPLPGTLTRHSVRARFGGRDCVVRLPDVEPARAGANLVSEREATAAAAAMGVGPEVVAFLDDPACLVTAYLPGRTLSLEDLGSPALISEVAVALLSFHEGPRLRTAFSPYAAIEADAHGDVVAVARRIAQALDPAHPEHAPVPCHNDLGPGCLIHDADRIWIVGWKRAGMGNRYFDLACLAASCALSAAGEEWLLESYFGEAPTRRRLATLRLMRVVAELHTGRSAAARAAASDPRFAVWLADAAGR
jgi:aminoglycoside phosphotransferase